MTVYQTSAFGGLSRPFPDPNNVQLVDYTKEPKYLAAGMYLTYQDVVAVRHIAIDYDSNILFFLYMHT